MKPDDPFYEHYTSICKIIVSPMRLKIIEALGNEKLNVSEIQAKLRISMSNLSNHLAALHSVGVVGREKQGNFTYYYLVEPDLLEVLQQMRGVIHSIVSKRSQMMLASEIMPG